MAKKEGEPKPKAPEEPAPRPVDTTNIYIVSSVAGGRILIANPPRSPMDKNTALGLAAWLVAMVGDDERWDEVLKAVQNT